MKKASRRWSNTLPQKNTGKKWGLITQDDDYGIAVRDGFDAVVKDKKLNVVYSGNYKKGQQDFSSEMLRLKDSGAEVFLAGGIIGENVAMIKEMEKLGIKPTVGIFWPGRVEVGAQTDGAGQRWHLCGRLRRAVRRPRRKGLPGKGKASAPGSRDSRASTVTPWRATARPGHCSLRSSRCGKDVTWACTIAELEKTKNLETGIMAPISFGPGVRFSNQKLQIMQAEFSTLSFKPVN